MAFVDTAKGFRSSVSIRRDTESVDGRSIMAIMTLAATCGTEIEVVCEGDDAKDCLAALSALVDRGFADE